MSIRSLYGMPERRGMDKKAEETLKAFFSYLDWKHAMLLAMAVGAGSGIGWLTAKATAKGKASLDTARTAYQNERTIADIGNLRTKLENEYKQKKRDELSDPQNSMRLLS